MKENGKPLVRTLRSLSLSFSEPRRGEEAGLAIAACLRFRPANPFCAPSESLRTAFMNSSDSGSRPETEKRVSRTRTKGRTAKKRKPPRRKMCQNQEQQPANTGSAFEELGHNSHSSAHPSKDGRLLPASCGASSGGAPFSSV